MPALPKGRQQKQRKEGKKDMQPRNPLWDKIRRYLILWAVILILLNLIALFQYWDQIVAALGTGVEQTLSGIISLVIVVAIFVYMIRAFFN